MAPSRQELKSSGLSRSLGYSPVRRRGQPDAKIARSLLAGLHFAPHRLSHFFVVLLFAFCSLSRTDAAQVFVTNVADIAVASSTNQPGDVLIMRDGLWPDADIIFRATGTPENPITLRAQTPGRVLLTGQSRLRIAGSYLVVQGLLFTNGYRTNSDVISFRFNSATIANNCRLTECAVINYNPSDTSIDSKWVSMYGVSNRVDNCYFRGKLNLGSTLVVQVDSSGPNYHQIDHNHFAFRAPYGDNGGETVRVGSSDVSLSPSRTVVEYNYFEFCNGDAEIVSSKSCENIYRYNTFFECEGSLTLRHGNGCTVEGNYFFGGKKLKTGGIRIIGEDHKVFNNYCIDLTGTTTGAGISINKGLTNSPLNGYFQVKRAVVAFNTLINCSNNLLVALSATQSGTTNVTTLPPEDCVIANNIIVGSTPHDDGVGDEEDFIGEPDFVPGRNLLDIRGEMVRFTWQGNILFGAVPGTFDTNGGIREIDPKLALGTDRLWRLGATSPARGGAQGTFSYVTTDFDGQARLLPTDIGADQFSADPVSRSPLSAIDVGPPWLRPSATQVTWNTPTNIVYGTPLGNAQLNAQANVLGTFVYSPPAGTVLNAGTGLTLTVVFTPNDLVKFSVITQAVTINVTKANSQITWSSPANIVYGTTLGSAQLNATANVAGSFVYSPPAGTLLNAGFGQALSVAFTPTDTTNYNASSRNVAISVLQATPVITWSNPANITNGTPLGPQQLNATANVAGTFTYNPPAGTVLNAGSGQPLFVSFTPSNTVNYTTASKSVSIDVIIVGRIVPTITWPTPADIIEGTPLGNAQLNATADVPGSFFYNPGAGTVLSVGLGQALSATFTPTDTNTYAVVSKSVSVNVVKPTALVRVAYIVPTNRVAQPDAVTDLKNAVLLYQDWFREQMQRNGFGPKTFTIEKDTDGLTPKIHVLNVANTDADLRSDIWGGRVLDACRNLALPIGTSGQVWWLVPEVHLEDPDGSIRGGFDLAYTYGGSADDAGWAMSSGDFLARCQPEFLTNNTPYDGLVVSGIGPYPLSYDITFPWFEGTTLSAISSSALGSALRCLGEAFGLEHDFRNDQNFNGNVMGFGFRGFRGIIYPQLYPFNDTRLSYGLALMLNVSPYFNPGRTTTDSVLPNVTIATSGTNTPVNGSLRITFSASDNNGLSAALLCWMRDSDRVIIDEMALNGTSTTQTFVTPYYESGRSNQYFVSVFDLQGNKRAASAMIVPRTVVNHAPLPSIKASPVNVGPGEDVILDASGTFDAEHEKSLLEVEWDLDGDGFFDTVPVASLFFTNNYPYQGSYLVRARVTDPAGADAVSAPVGVNVTPCATTLSPLSRSHGFGATTNSVTVTAGAKCLWSAIANDSWISFLNGTNRQGSGALSYVLAPNQSLSPRVGTFSVGDHTFTITQSEVVCTIRLSVTGRPHGFGATTNTVTVTVNNSICSWTVSKTNDWITILSETNVLGGGTMRYAITANRNPTERIGTIMVGDQPFTITQWGTNCTYVVNPSAMVHSATMETGVVSLLANSACDWVVVNTNITWITLLSNDRGVGVSNVIYRVDPNPSLIPRSAIINVADKLVTISQTACSFTLATNSAHHTYSGGVGQVTNFTVSGCPWEVLNTTPWISVTSASPTNGTAVVTYTVLPNTRNTPRTGGISIAGHPFTVVQDGEPCSYELAEASYEHGEGQEVGAIEVLTGQDCRWEVVNTNSWISFPFNPRGFGSSDVIYSVERNLGAARQGFIVIRSIGGQTNLPFLVKQGRGLRLGSLGTMTLASGQASCVSLVLETRGNEAMVDLSLCYDPRVLTFVSARPSIWVPQGRVDVNTNALASGQVGLALRMPDGWSLRAGTQSVMEVCFLASTVTGNVTTAISVCDQPLPRRLVGVGGTPLAAAYTNGSATVIGICTFGEAVDAPQYAWTMANGNWVCQNVMTHDGMDAAESPFVAEGSSSSFLLNVVGPGTISFWWKVSSQPSSDRLRFYVGGTEQVRISGESVWSNVVIAISAAATDVTELEWRYSKNSDGILGGADRGWVDQIQFVGSAPTISSHPASQTVDAGTAVTFNVSATGTAPVSYRWQRNGADLSDGGNITGSTSASLRIISAQVGDAGTYTVIVRNPLGEVVSSNAVLSVTAIIPLAEAVDTPGVTWTTSGTPPWNGQTVITHDGEDAAHAGGSGSSTKYMQMSVTGPGTVSFWWKVSSSTNNDTLRFIISSSSSSSGTEQTRISGEVDWEKRTFNVPSGTQFLRWQYSKSSSTPVGQDRGWVDRIEYGPMAPLISSQPAGVNTDAGATVTFNVVAAGSQPLSYQWQFMGVNLDDIGGVRGATTPSLTISNVQLAHGGQYYVTVRNAAGVAVSSNAALQVSAVVPLAEAVDATELIWTSVGSPVWVGQAQTSHDGVDAARSGTVAASQTATLETRVVGPGTISFWWKVSSEPSDDRLRFYIAGSEQANISGEQDWQWRSFPVSSSGTNILQWRYQKDSDTVVGLEDRGWVDEVRYIPNSVPTVPVIIIDPTNRTVVAGSNVIFAVTAFGSATLSYQWQLNGLNLTNGGGIGGVTTPTLGVTNAQGARSGFYSVIVSNAAGTVSSASAELRVITAPEITLQPQDRQAVAGGTTNFTVAALGAPTLRYQWRLNGTNLPASGKFSGTTTTNLVVSNIAVEQAGPYTVVITNAAGTVISDPAFLSVVSPPSIVVQPLAQTVPAGTNVLLNVSVAGAPPFTYQWRCNGTNLNDGGTVTGTRTSTLSIADVQADKAGSYSVVVSNSVGSATSGNAALAVITPPVILIPPASQTVNQGANVNFGVVAGGTAPLSYRWLYNGAPLTNGGSIANVLTTNLSVANVQPAHTGDYSVVVSNAAGVTVSAAAHLTVRAALTLGEALDAEQLIWTTALAAPWLAQTNVMHDGIDAARSGNIASNQTTWLETAVEGPGTLRFWWKVSSEPNNDRLVFSVSGSEWGAISGDVDWRWEIFTLPPGPQTLRWSYTKNGTVTNGQDRGWLDEVQFTRTVGPSPPVIGRQPLSQDVEPGVNVTFSVAASGSAPMSYRWHFNGVELIDSDFVQGSMTPTLTLLNVQAANNGTYNVMVRNDYSWDVSSNAVLTVIPTIPLPEALDKDDTIWVTGATLGGSRWVGQGDVTYDWLDAAQSGVIGSMQTNYIETTVLGPGAVSFWWKVSSETNADRLRFYVSGAERANISGEVDWRWRTFDVGVGNQVLRWAYTKNASNSVGLDRAWVDFVQFGPAAPIITNQPDSEEIVDIGGSVRISVDASGTQPFTYQWRFNGTNLIDADNISGANNRRLFISNAMPWQVGRYSVLVGNAGGRALSDECIVTVLPSYPLAEALNTPGWEWRSYGFAWWVGSPDNAHDGVLCARNGLLANSEESWMETTLIGPGTLKYYWKVSSEANRDWLRFFVNSNELAAISGNVDWNQRTFELPPGTNICKWRYSKDSINTNGLDRAFVDEVSFGFTGPGITTQPVGQTVDQGSTVTFTVANVGTPPFTYQWRRDGIPLSDGNGVTGASNTTLRIANVQPSQAGTYSVVVRNIGATTFSSNAVLTVNPIFPLAEAVDLPGSSWTVSGTPPWVGQPQVSHDGVDAARSGATSGSGTTYAETTIAGPGTVTFWWRVSSLTNAHYLRFRFNGSDVVSISGESGWLQRTQTLNQGNNTLRWSYIKSSSATAGQDRGWLDEIVVRPTPPSITSQPTNRVVDQGGTATFSVTAGGGPPFTYQWRFNGVPLFDVPGVRGARSNLLTLTNVVPAQSGNYNCVVANSSGSITSAVALLTVNPTYPLAEALDTPGLIWATSGSSPTWYGQGAITHDGRDAAQSGPNDVTLGSGSRSMQITVTGPGRVSFWGKVSSYTNNNYLEFYIGSTRQNPRISGEVDWTNFTFNVTGSGSQTLRWTYNKGSSTVRGLDRAWVDEVVYTPNVSPGGGPPPEPQPIYAAIETVGNTISLTWQANPEKVYCVYYKDDLNDPDWKVLDTVVFVDGTLGTAYDTVDAEAIPQRFYLITEY